MENKTHKVQSGPKQTDNVRQLNRAERRAQDVKRPGGKLNPKDFVKKPGETDDQLDQRFAAAMSDDELKAMFIIQTKRWDALRVQLNIMALEMNKRKIRVEGKPAKVIDLDLKSENKNGG